MQNIQNKIRLNSPSSVPTVRLKTNGRLIKVLLVTADRKEAYLIRKMVTQAVMGAFAFDYADRLSAGIKRLAGGGIDVLLLDPSVPDGRGLYSLTQVREQFGDIPVIILSPLDNENDRTEALKKGAREYLFKGKVTGDLLMRSIQRAIAPPRPLTVPESGEAQFEDIIKSYPEGIIIVDQKGEVCFANPAVASLFGCRAEQLLGESIDSLRTIEGGRTEIGIVRADGENLVAEVKVVETKYRGETAYLASLRDITERKKAEEEARLARLEVEAVKVASTKMIEKANEEARLAREDAEFAKTTSNKTIARTREEFRQAREEAEAMKAASAGEIEKAAEEARRAREESMEARVALEKAREETRQAQEEIKEIKAALDKAREEARLAKKEAEKNRAIIERAHEEARQAGDEVEEIRADAAEAIARAGEEARIAREEAEAAKAASDKALEKADEEVRLAREEVEAVKAASARAIAKAKAEADAAKAASAKAVKKTSEEVRLAKEETEAVKVATDKALEKAKEEARLALEEAEEVRAASAKAVARANEGVGLAREEAEAAKVASARAIKKAGEEARLAREEAVAAKLASTKAVAKAEEEARLAREEAEAARAAYTRAIEKANEEARLALEEAEEVKAASAKAVARANEEARLAREEAETAKALSEEVMTRAAEKRYNLDPMQSEFMSNIVHELRAPLHSILAFTKLLLEGDVTSIETQKEFLAIIDNQSEHLRKLVNELIDISPIESGRLEIVRERVAVKELLQSCLRDFASMAKQKNITIIENMPSQLPDIEGDSQRLRQVMFNLLDNAIKFSRDGGSIHVNTEVSGTDLLVKVVDEGIGIAEKARESLFEKYYQVKNTARTGGLGLGLYLSKRVVEAHGGRIWAESQEGAGSTFSFTIPLKQDNR